MKNLLSILSLVVAISVVSPLSAADDRWETLKAINWVENPTNHTRFGSKGELGPYQFRSQTWRMHTSRPFSQAVVREAADEVAVKHYEWIRRGLSQAGIDPSPYNIALVWNCGLGAVKSGRVPMSTYRYAEQVTNLVEMLKERQLAEKSDRAAAPSAKPASVRPRISINAPAIVFSVNGPEQPRFLIEPAEPLYEPVVYTDKTPVATPAEEERSLFVFATVGTPRFALLD